MNKIFVEKKISYLKESKNMLELMMSLKVLVKAINWFSRYH